MTGFTLIEALVAIVVVSIGLLGLLGLQTTAVINTQNSQARTLANFAAQDIADRIRANPTAPSPKTNENAASVYENISPATSNAPGQSRCRTNCTGEDLARLDRDEWQALVASVLPAGKGFVDCAKREGGRCREFIVTVGWQARETDDQPFPAGLNRCPSNTHAAAIDGFCTVSELRP